MAARKRIMINSTLGLHGLFGNSEYTVPMSCVVYGVYLESTGTLIFEEVYCDGNSYTYNQLSSEEQQKFMDELAHAVISGDF